MNRTIKVGDLVEITEDQGEGPPIGTRCRVLDDDGSGVPYRVEWGRDGWWLGAAEVKLVEGGAGQTSPIMALLQGGWSVSAQTSSVDESSSVLAWRHPDYDASVEIGGGTVDISNSADWHVFSPAELRAFAALAEETD